MWGFLNIEAFLAALDPVGNLGGSQHFHVVGTSLCFRECSAKLGEFNKLGRIDKTRQTGTKMGEFVKTRQIPQNSTRSNKNRKILQNQRN